MTNFKYKFLKASVITLAFICLGASHSYAEDPITVKAISAEKWAEENPNFNKYVGILNDNNNAICGAEDRLCPMDQKQCVRCNIRIFQYELGGLWNDKVGDHWVHFCLGKDEDLRKFEQSHYKKVPGEYRITYGCEKALGRANFDVWNGSGENGIPSNLEITAMGATMGAAIGSVIPVVGTGVGGIVGAAVGQVTRIGSGLFKAWMVSDTEWLTDAQEICAEGSDGKKYCLEGLGNDITVTYGDEKKATTKCEILPVKLHNLRKCFFCPLFAVIYNAAGSMAYISFSKLAAAFATLIALGLAIWIAFQTLTHVSSLTKQDAPKFLGNLIKQSYKFLIAFLLLQNSTEIYRLAVTPVLEAGIAFGGQFLTHYQASKSTQEQIELETGQRVDMISTEAATYYSKSTYQKLDTYVGDIQREISFMQAVGTSLICTGNRGMFHKTQVTEFSDGFKMFIQGVVIAAFAFLLSIAFAFYMIDAVAQLGIVGALMPFLIASWPFKITAQYTGTGMKMLLNSAFVFVFIGLTVSVNLNLIGAAMSNTGNQKQTEERLRCQQEEYREQNKEACEKALDETSFGGLSAVAEAINSQDEAQLIELTDISGMGFLILLFCCIFGFKFMGQVSSLAGQFSSGGIKPIAPSIATMGGSAALSGAKKLTKPVREAVGRKAEDAEMAVVGAVAHPVKTAKSIGRGITNVVNKFRGKKGGGSSESSSESESEETKSKKKSGTAESSGQQGPKKKGAVVGQKGGKSGETDSTKPGSAPGEGGSKDSPKPSEEKPVESNEEATPPADTNEDSGTAGQTKKKKSAKPESRKQRKYPRKNRDKMRRNKQRRNYGRRHK